jgi:hypothetical protein
VRLLVERNTREATMNHTRRTDRRDDRRTPDALQAFEPTIRSAVGAVWETLVGVLLPSATVFLLLLSNDRAVRRGCVPRQSRR